MGFLGHFQPEIPKKFQNIFCQDLFMFGCGCGALCRRHRRLEELWTRLMLDDSRTAQWWLPHFETVTTQLSVDHVQQRLWGVRFQERKNGSTTASTRHLGMYSVSCQCRTNEINFRMTDAHCDQQLVVYSAEVIKLAERIHIFSLFRSGRDHRS